MFKPAVDVAGELSTRISTFKNQRDNRRVRIANFFDKIGTALEKIVEALDETKPYEDQIKELETYVASLSAAVGDIIGPEKTDQLTASLKSAFDEENFSRLAALSGPELAEHKSTLKEASDKFIKLWDALNY